MQALIDELEPERAKTIPRRSIDMSGGYEKASCENLPDAEICMDPFVRHEALPVLC